MHLSASQKGLIISAKFSRLQTFDWYHFHAMFLQTIFFSYRRREQIKIQATSFMFIYGHFRKMRNKNGTEKIRFERNCPKVEKIKKKMIIKTEHSTDSRQQSWADNYLLRLVLLLFVSFYLSSSSLLFSPPFAHFMMMSRVVRCAIVIIGCRHRRSFRSLGVCVRVCECCGLGTGYGLRVYLVHLFGANLTHISVTPPSSNGLRVHSSLFGASAMTEWVEHEHSKAKYVRHACTVANDWCILGERGRARETENPWNEWRELVLLPTPPPPPTNRRFSSISCDVFGSVHTLRACRVDEAVSDTRKTFNSKATKATATLQAAEQDQSRKRRTREREREIYRVRKNKKNPNRVGSEQRHGTESRRLHFFVRFVLVFFFLLLDFHLHSTSFNFSAFGVAVSATACYFVGPSCRFSHNFSVWFINSLFCIAFVRVVDLLAARADRQANASWIT